MDPLLQYNERTNNMDATNKNKLVKELNKKQIMHFETKDQVVIDCSNSNLYGLSKLGSRQLVEQVLNLEYQFIDTVSWSDKVIVS